VGYGLWKANGTLGGTRLVASWVSPPGFLTNLNGTLFFAVSSGLWKSDGTEAGTVLVPGSESSTPTFLTNVDGTLFFAANSGTLGRELWKSDGTEAGTVLVKDIAPGLANSAPPRSTT
jgi:ELWxxDGT repeat protein